MATREIKEEEVKRRKRRNFWNQRMELAQGVRGQEQVLKEELVRGYPSETLHCST